MKPITTLLLILASTFCVVGMSSSPLPALAVFFALAAICAAGERK